MLSCYAVLRVCQATAIARLCRPQPKHTSINAVRCISNTLPRRPCRTRFAPSPTGHLHLGSLRTALFNFLLAKATKGQFILRLEDTDQSRTVADAEARIYADLKWAGLEIDEGPTEGGPYGLYRQSERSELYQKEAEQLLDSGKAYRCFCSAERLQNLAQERSNLGLQTNYDKVCAGLESDVSRQRAAQGERFTVRFKSPVKYPEFQDLVYGRVGRSKFQEKAKHLGDANDDFILLKSDGMPTYHFANVVDDHHMKITHVIRGIEWMPSTPKHLALYEALKWQPPALAHVGLLQDERHQKLSKRSFATDIQSFSARGVIPEALTNFVALLGWSHREQSDLLPMADMIKRFDLKFTKGNTVVNMQKLDYLQRAYARKYISEGGHELEKLVMRNCAQIRQDTDPTKLLVPSQHTLESYVSALLVADSKHFSYPSEFVSRNRGFLEKQISRGSLKESQEPSMIIKTLIQRFSILTEHEWDEKNLKVIVSQVAQEKSKTQSGQSGATPNETNSHEIAGKTAAAQISQVMRWAIMGGNTGPPIVASMTLLGRDCTLQRLRESLIDCE